MFLLIFVSIFFAQDSYDSTFVHTSYSEIVIHDSKYPEIVTIYPTLDAKTAPAFEIR